MKLSTKAKRRAVAAWAAYVAVVAWVRANWSNIAMGIFCLSLLGNAFGCVAPETATSLKQAAGLGALSVE